MSLAAGDFAGFVEAVHGYRPFAWQQRLCDQVLHQGWPRILQVPTAAGKTSLLDVAVFALAAGSSAARRRVALVVDRRVVVDQASQHARRLAAALRAGSTPGIVGVVADRLRALGGEETPLVTATLRGGLLRDDAWARSPAQPAVICSTVDQVGSRLLFRGYGCRSPRSWPIHAGLLGLDTLLIVDEAHCAQPFCETALTIAAQYGGWAEAPVGAPLTLVRMSATVAEATDFVLSPEERREPALAPRLQATKRARLHLTDGPASAADHRRWVGTLVGLGQRLAAESPRVVGVVVNRVATARAVFDALDLPIERKLLLTGRVRGWDRDRLFEAWRARLTARPDRPSLSESVIVVATQCIEVGANLDFDALVTECAPLDALRQRFGRLNRLGLRVTAPAVIVAAREQVDPQAEDDPVYGPALRQTWDWLQSVAGKDEEDATVDCGIEALERLLPAEEELTPLLTPARHAPLLLPAYVDLLVQTHPAPEPCPEPGLFLHGHAAGADDVQVVWRADLRRDRPEQWLDLVALLPPLAGEACPVPWLAARAWLAQAASPPQADGDVAGEVPPDRGEAPAAGTALRWRGVDESTLIDATALRPGDTIVVPADVGGCDTYGWNPSSAAPVVEIADAIALRAQGRPVLRLHASVVRTWVEDTTDDMALAAATAAATRLRGSTADAAVDVADELAGLAALDGLRPWVREACQALAADRRRRVRSAFDTLVIVGRRAVARGDLTEAESDFVGTSDESTLTTRVALDEHSVGVALRVTAFAERCHLRDALAADLVLAAQVHDLGKADERFQVVLWGGDAVAAALQDRPLAKSPLGRMSRAALLRARVQAGYPRGGRHELQSLALLDAAPWLLAGAADPDLVRYLVSTHHGFARPFAPVVEDPEPVDVTVRVDDRQITASSDHRLYALDRGVPDRFWLLVRRYGWWGLAFLEAVLRLADHRRSEDEERAGEAD